MIRGVSALSELLRELEARPRDVQLLAKLAQLHQRAGRLDQAAAALMRVAEEYAAQGFFLKAVAVAKQVLKLDPRLIQVNVRLADWHFLLGLGPEAVGYARRAADAFRRSGRSSEAAALEARLLGLEPPPKAQA
jgi:tetratricopeptide (TPR) repeat protein